MLRDPEPGDVEEVHRCLRDVVALSTLPAVWLGAETFRVAESLAAALFTTVRAELVYVSLEDGAGMPPVVVCQTGRYTTDAELAGRIGTQIREWARTHDPDDLLTLPRARGSSPLYIAARPLGFDAGFGVMAAGFTDRTQFTTFQHTLLAVAATQASSAVQNAQLMRSLRQNIAEREQAERALRDEVRTQEMLNEAGRKLAAELDLARTIHIVTQAATEVCGARVGAFFSAAGADSEGWMPLVVCGEIPERDATLSALALTAFCGPALEGNAVVRFDDMSEAACDERERTQYAAKSYLAAPVVSRSGEVIGALCFGHDEPGVFTDRAERLVSVLASQAAVAIDNARLHEQRTQLIEQLRETDRRKDEFLAMLAHELRNPLAPIRTAAQLLHIICANEPRVRQASEIIARQAHHMTELVDDLLDVSRVTRGLIRLHVETLEVRELIAEAIEQVRPLVEARHHRLTVDAGEESVRVRGDRTRLVQVLTNVLNNAAKYTPMGGTIEVRVQADAGGVELSVRDNGIGLTPELRPHVFELFTQGQRAPDRAHGGLGLGLALVKSLVELHGGRVAAYSDGAGEGSRFTVWLPRCAAAEDLTDAAREGPCRAVASSALKVMIVDDNVDAAQSLALLLEAEEYCVSVEYDAHAALKRARLEAPDVLLLDLGLPEVDGYELARRLRNLPGTRNAVLIAVTGYGQDEDRRRSHAAGFDHHLLKPVDPTQLMALLAELDPDPAIRRRAS
jgi:signal transduction histidine kinase/ActR/RegA family two-component response regulator